MHLADNSRWPILCFWQLILRCFIGMNAKLVLAWLYMISNSMVFSTIKDSDQPLAYAWSDQSLCYRRLAWILITGKLLIELHLELLRLKRGCTWSSESYTSHYATLLEINGSYSFFRIQCWARSTYALTDPWLNGPRREKTCLRGCPTSEFQTSLLSYRD